MNAPPNRMEIPMTTPTPELTAMARALERLAADADRLEQRPSHAVQVGTPGHNGTNRYNRDFAADIRLLITAAQSALTTEGRGDAEKAGSVGPEEFLRAVRVLVVAARTSGGVAGPDQGLMDALDEVDRTYPLVTISASPTPPIPASSATPAEGVDLEGAARIIANHMMDEYHWDRKASESLGATLEALLGWAIPPALPDELVRLSERATKGDAFDALVFASAASTYVRSLQKEKTDGR